MQGGNAFIPLGRVLDSTPFEIVAVPVIGYPHTIWELTEHIRLALHDLVEYSKDSWYQSPPWPEGYWPEHRAPESQQTWLASVAEIKRLIGEMVELISDPEIDLYSPFEAYGKHHLLRQATIVAEHNAYHNGQIVMLRKHLNAWET